MEDLQYYQNKRTGEKFFLFGFANYIANTVMKNVVVFHPEKDPHALYVMDTQCFNILYTKWKEDGEERGKE